VQVVDDADAKEHIGPIRSEGTATRLAVHWMSKMNKVVDIVYAEGMRGFDSQSDP
jgi:hypothetical protein